MRTITTNPLPATATTPPHNLTKQPATAMSSFKKGALVVITGLFVANMLASTALAASSVSDAIEDPISQAQAEEIFHGVATNSGLDNTSVGEIRFSDVKDSDWFTPYLKPLVNKGAIKGYEAPAGELAKF